MKYRKLRDKTLSKLVEASYSGALKGENGSSLILRQDSDLGKFFSALWPTFFSLRKLGKCRKGQDKTPCDLGWENGL